MPLMVMPLTPRAFRKISRSTEATLVGSPLAAAPCMSGRCRQHPRAGTKEAKERQSPRGERVGLGTRVVYAFWRPLQRSGSFRARPSDPGAPTRSIMILKLSPPPPKGQGKFQKHEPSRKVDKIWVSWAFSRYPRLQARDSIQILGQARAPGEAESGVKYKKSI